MKSRLSMLADDLRLGLTFYTRLPVPLPPVAAGAALARASWTGPVAGALIGLLSALAYGSAAAIGLPPWPSAALAVTASLAVTGCLHEDGLADMADGFGGGATRERKLEIMRDSRIGTYGACALIMSLLLRASAIASLADPVSVVGALIAAHAASRAVTPAFMACVPPARTDGLSAGVGKPAGFSMATAVVLGAIALGLGLGPLTGIIALVLVGAAAGFLAWLCRRQIGGQTGDVLGAVQQAGEMTILLVAAARAGGS